MCEHYTFNWLYYLLWKPQQETPGLVFLLRKEETKVGTRNSQVVTLKSWNEDNDEWHRYAEEVKKWNIKPFSSCIGTSVQGSHILRNILLSFSFFSDRNLLGGNKRTKRQRKTQERRHPVSHFCPIAALIWQWIGWWFPEKISVWRTRTYPRMPGIPVSLKSPEIYMTFGKLKYYEAS